MSILIVEDNPATAKLLEKSLGKAGHKTITASDGVKALKSLESKDDIDLIVCDIVMPNVGGLELLGVIKNYPEWESLPVIMCTARSEPEVVKLAMNMGCTDYMVKPIDTEVLIQKIGDILS